MKAQVNGVEWELAEGTTMAEVLRRTGAPPSGVAVALGGELVPRGSWPATPVRDGDVIEIVTAVQGG